MEKAIYRNQKINDVGRFKYRLTEGIKKGLIVKGRQDEVEITNKFSKHFGVTFSKQGKFKTTEYTYAFLQPSENLKESFNMYNEVLLLFSPYEVFERRTLDFVDKTLLDFDNRLDKVCIFIISKDSKIEEVIGSINKENKDSKIIVPFTYQEAELLNKDLLYFRLRKYFYNRDLFALESPLKTDAYFFGRTEVVQRLYDKYSIGEQAGLFGLRKIGKTSVLFALERLIKLRGGYSIYIDCQSPSIYKLEWNELLYYLTKEIVKKYDFEINIKREDFTAKLATESFKNSLLQIYKMNSGRRVLIIFDEIENISFDISPEILWKNGTSFLSFWQAIRSVFQENQQLFSFVITGVNPLCIETINIGGYDNPIFGMLNPEYLKLFGVDDVKNMVSNIGCYMGLRFDEEIYTKLTDEYGGHPFLIRHICSLIHNNVTLERPYTVVKYEYMSKKDEYNRQIYSYIQLILQILDRWYPQEYKLLETLAYNGVEEFKKSIFNANQEIEHLLGYGILKKVNTGYFITIDAVSEYLKEKFDEKLKPSSIEKTWEKVSVERNSLEVKLRRLIITILNVQFGKKNIKDKILEIVDSGRKEKFHSKDLNWIVENELYLLDCKNLISKHWNIFEKFFVDKHKFEMFLDIINQYRVDAHAKNITEDDYAILMIAFKWFDNAMENID